MLTKLLGNVAVLLGDQAIARSKLWNKDIESVSAPEIVAFIKLEDMAGRGEQARASIDVLLSEVRAAIGRGEIAGAPIERLRPSEYVMTMGDLYKILEGLPEGARRNSVRFALATDTPLERMVSMRWPEARRLVEIRPRAAEVLATVPRHLHTDLVFWEYVRGRLSPLMGLVAHFELASNGMAFDTLRDAYKTMIPISFEVDYAALRELDLIGKMIQ